MCPKRISPVSSTSRLVLLVGCCLLAWIGSHELLAQTDNGDLNENSQPQDVLADVDLSGIPLPDQERAREALRAKLIEMRQQREFDQKFTQRLVRMPELATWLSDPQRRIDLANLELVQDQRDEIQQLKEQLDDELEELDRLIRLTDDPREVSQLKQNRRVAQNEFKKQLIRLLMPEQIRLLQNSNPWDVPLARLVTESLFSEQLHLTEGQRQAIADRSHRLATEIEEFVQKKRREAVEIALSELTDSQREELFRLIDKKQLAKLEGHRSLETLYRYLVDPEQLGDDGDGQPSKSQHGFSWTDINFEKR